MKFLLVALNAKYIHSNPALYSLRAYVGEELQKHVEIAEYTINHGFTDILADIYRRKPDVIGLSCYIWNINMMLELVKELTKLLPHVPIWLGGPEVTYDAPKLLEKYPMLAGVMLGEGEATFRELLECYVNYYSVESHVVADVIERERAGSDAVPRQGRIGDDAVPEKGRVGDDAVPGKGSVGNYAVSGQGRVGDDVVPGKGSVGDYAVPEKGRVGDDAVPEKGRVGNYAVSGQGRIGDDAVPEKGRVGNYAVSGQGRIGDNVVSKQVRTNNESGIRFGVGLSEREIRLEHIPGLCLPGGFTRPRELTDMSTLPFLYGDLEQFRNRIIYYESSRGCPFRCSYCLSSIDKKVRLRDISVVKTELQFFLDHKVKQVKFVDRTFNCNHQHAMAIWQYILKNDNGVTNFHFEIAADILSEEELALLHKMRPGLVQLEIGVQSTNPQTLEAIHRVMDVEKLEQIVASINSGKNVHQHLDLIAGLPYEDYESFGKSFDRVYAMKPEQLQLGFLKVLKGSEMCERAQEYGIHYTDKAPYEVLFTNWLTFEDVLRLKRIEEMVELYYNSNQFVHTLQFLVQVFESPFRMYEALALFYEEKGYFVNSPARNYRYNVLLEFARECDGQYESVYRELLTYDMYLRENLKSRPDFARDLLEFKEVTRSFYKQEEEHREYLPAYVTYDSKQLARMTHLEPFYFPVWEMPDRIMTRVSEMPDNPTFVLFDYQERNPLTGDSRTVQV